jgi:hypothetical protein
MIRPLRQHHRRMVIALGVFLPVAFVVGVAARKPAPTVAELPLALTVTSQKFEAVEREYSDLFSRSPVQVQLLREQKNSGRFAVAFSATKDFIKPDLMVYWVSGNPDITSALPGNAVLLGAFDSAALPLPSETSTHNGVLVLYSLANNEIVDVSKPFSILPEGRVPRGPDSAMDDGVSQSSSLRK